MLGLAQPVNADVDRVVKLGEVGADLFAGNEIGKLPTSIKNFQTAIDRIVVRDGDQVHSPPLERGVNVQRLRIAVPAAQEAEVFRPPREAAVAMQVGFIELVELSLKHEVLY